MFSTISEIVAFVADLVVILFFGSVMVQEAIRATKERGMADDDEYEEREPTDAPPAEDVEDIFPLRYSKDEGEDVEENGKNADKKL